MGQHAVVGEFRPAKDILVIDMTALPELPSIFQEDVAQRYDRVPFLRRFAEDIVQPIELDEREHIEYVPTQVFTEYLRYALPGRRHHGLVFSSARASGRNCVLFCGPESVAAHSNQSDDAVITIGSATLTAYRKLRGTEFFEFQWLKSSVQNFYQEGRSSLMSAEAEEQLFECCFAAGKRTHLPYGSGPGTPEPPEEGTYLDI
jgi:hypothetical protein